MKLITRNTNIDLQATKAILSSRILASERNFDQVYPNLISDYEEELDNILYEHEQSQQQIEIEEKTQYEQSQQQIQIEKEEKHEQIQQQIQIEEEGPPQTQIYKENNEILPSIRDLIKPLNVNVIESQQLDQVKALSLQPSYRSKVEHVEERRQQDQVSDKLSMSSQAIEKSSTRGRTMAAQLLDQMKQDKELDVQQKLEENQDQLTNQDYVLSLGVLDELNGQNSEQDELHLTRINRRHKNLAKLVNPIGATVAQKAFQKAQPQVTKAYELDDILSQARSFSPRRRQTRQDKSNEAESSLPKMSPAANRKARMKLNFQEEDSEPENRPQERNNSQSNSPANKSPAARLRARRRQDQLDKDSSDQDIL